MAYKRVVKLRDESTQFHDFETGFDLARGQQKELGEKIGRATRQALHSGRLVEVHQPSTALMKLTGNGQGNK